MTYPILRIKPYAGYDWQTQSTVEYYKVFYTGAQGTVETAVVRTPPTGSTVSQHWLNGHSAVESGDDSAVDFRLQDI